MNTDRCAGGGSAVGSLYTRLPERIERDGLILEPVVFERDKTVCGRRSEGTPNINDSSFGDTLPPLQHAHQIYQKPNKK